MHRGNQNDWLLAAALKVGVVVLAADASIIWCNQVASQIFDIQEPASGSTKIQELFVHLNLGYLLSRSATTSQPIEVSSPIDAYARLSITVSAYHSDQRLLIAENITHTLQLESIRQDFVANVSHELRTPLTVFHGYLDILLATPSISRDKLQDIYTQMAGQTTRMERLVEDLLLLSKLESVEPDLAKHEDINVCVLLREIIRDAKSLSDGQHHFLLEADESLFLHGNLAEIHSAFSNLIFNAVRYTPEGGHINVKWLQQNSKSVLVVKDTGIGIASKHLPRITQRFYRVDKSRLYRGQGGTGLGLAIVKHVALRHNTELIINSELGNGSTFQLVF